MMRKRLRLTTTALRITGIGAVSIACLAWASSHQVRPEARQLPSPTGEYGVGRTAFHWIDSTRTDPLDPDPTARRELVVYAWYPAVRTAEGRKAPYIPDIGRLHTLAGDSVLREEFGQATADVMAGRINSEALLDARLASARSRWPVLLFSHGFGESVLTYAGQLADLASHGYVVFGVEHPHDAYAVLLTHDSIVRFAQVQWDSARALPKGAVSFQLAQVPIRASDLRFVLGRVTALAHAPASQTALLAGRLDLGRIGAFGHSLGGIAAASACRLDPRIRACMNEDADDDGRPWSGGVAGRPPKQPFLFFVSGHSIYVSARTPLPTDAQLAGMRLTRAAYDSIVRTSQSNQDAALASLPAGGWRVMAEAPTFTHRTFIDLRILQAPTYSAWREQTRHLEVIRRIVRAFFDVTLSGADPSELSGAAAMDSTVTVQHYPPTLTGTRAAPLR